MSCDFAPRRAGWPLLNYRHAFHAGNFADCMKHAVLVWLLRALQRKPAPLFVLDTHAGAGRYDLDTGPAARTGEWRSGIARLLDDPPPALADYVGLVAIARPLSRLAGADRARTAAPGRPAGLLRTPPRGRCRTAPPFRAATRQVAVHHRDAWEALGALLPPKERRGLVLIDPPFEDPQEFADLAAGLATGYAAFPHRRVRRLVSDQAPRAGAADSSPHMQQTRHARYRRRRTVPARAGRIRRG